MCTETSLATSLFHAPRDFSLYFAEHPFPPVWWHTLSYHFLCPQAPPPSRPFSSPPSPPSPHSSTRKIDLIKKWKGLFKRNSSIMKIYYCIPATACRRCRRQRPILFSQISWRRRGGVSPCFPRPCFIIFSYCLTSICCHFSPSLPATISPLSSRFCIFRFFSHFLSVLRLMLSLGGACWNIQRETFPASFLTE